MVPKKKSAVLAFGIAVLIAGCGRPSNVAKQPDHDMTNATMELMLDSRSDNPVHTIAMPHDEPVFPPGPGREEFVTACVVCHSPRYITMQPRFSRTTWLSEVKKMKDVYLQSRRKKLPTTWFLSTERQTLVKLLGAHMANRVGSEHQSPSRAAIRLVGSVLFVGTL